MTKTLTSLLNWISSYLAWRGLAGLWLFVRHQIQARWGKDHFTVHDPDLGATALRAGSSDLHVYRQVVIMREYAAPPKQEAMLEARYAATLAAGQVPLIVDAGANIGLFARVMAARFPKARIVCIEPEPGNLVLARENCAGLDQVSFIEGALWHHDRGVQLSDPDAEPWAYSYEEGDAGAPEALTPTATVDGLLAENRDAELLLLKLDIEGAEANALPEDAAFWQASPIVYIEPHDKFPGQAASLQGVVRQPGYWMADYIVQGENLLIFPPHPAGGPVPA